MIINDERSDLRFIKTRNLWDPRLPSALSAAPRNQFHIDASAHLWQLGLNVLVPPVFTHVDTLTWMCSTWNWFRTSWVWLIHLNQCRRENCFKQEVRAWPCPAPSSGSPSAFKHASNKTSVLCIFSLLQDREALRHLQQPWPFPLRLSSQQPLAHRWRHLLGPEHAQVSQLTFRHHPSLPFTPPLCLRQRGDPNKDASGAVDVQLQGAAVGPSGTKRFQALPEEGIQR